MRREMDGFFSKSLDTPNGFQMTNAIVADVDVISRWTIYFPLYFPR